MKMTMVLLTVNPNNDRTVTTSMVITMVIMNKHTKTTKFFYTACLTLKRTDSVISMIRKVFSPVQLPVGLLGALERRREFLQRHELLRPAFLLVSAGFERLLLHAQREPRVLPTVHHHSAVGRAVAGAYPTHVVGFTLVDEVA